MCIIVYIYFMPVPAYRCMSMDPIEYCLFLNCLPLMNSTQGGSSTSDIPSSSCSSSSCSLAKRTNTWM